MPGFRKVPTETMGLSIWEGDPNDAGAHAVVLGWLREAVGGVFLDEQATLTNRVKGNLGEFIAHGIGKTYVFTNVQISPTANGGDPLSDVSGPGLDIVWLYLGADGGGDWVALQEVKTTGDPSLNLATDLNKDYDKLFARNGRYTLQTRLISLKNKLDEFGLGHCASRVTALGGPDARQAAGVFLVPTLMHDRANDAKTKLVAVRQTLLGQGWAANSVECWSIGLGDLDRRLHRVARGQL